MRIIEAEQRSDAWRTARAGIATASRAADILAKLKSGGEAAGRRNYRVQLAVERLTGLPMESGYVNASMQRGIELEPAALARYEAESGAIVRRTGFCVHDELPIGCSLDGDIEEMFGIVECKAPDSATHVSYLKAARVPSEYVPQITHQLWITGARFADFVSYDDRLPSGLDYFCVRVQRSELDIAGYAKEVEKFLAEVEEEYSALMVLRARQSLVGIPKEAAA